MIGRETMKAVLEVSVMQIITSISEFLRALWSQSSTALLALPTFVKQILLLALAISLVMSLARSAWKALKFVAMAALLYMVLVWLGIL